MDDFEKAGDNYGESGDVQRNVQISDADEDKSHQSLLRKMGQHRGQEEEEHRLAYEQMESVLSSLPEDPIDIKDVEKYVKKYAEKYPALTILVDRNLGLKAYMEGHDTGTSIGALSPPSDDQLNFGLAKESLGKNKCAFTVSNYLNLMQSGGFTKSAPKLMVEFLKGGAKLVMKMTDLKRGDCLFVKRRRTDEKPSRIGHVLLVRDRIQTKNGDLVLAIQDDAEVLGLRIVVASKEKKATMEGLIESVKVLMQNRVEQDQILTLLSQQFNPEESLKLFNCLQYRKNFPDTIRVQTMEDHYYTKQFYVGVRPQYSNDENVADGSS